ncbi:hypothetical protein E3Q22_04154 [Wallemia mellicola]|uniref:Uncharacterized protein n=1 Tax=Wallemia mellicola TaxID=1708541 RepID=A0A4T0LWW9_9BASI|nr:hypothetical protein E3Q24_03771 [Wallemia mellicola]TIB74641.1 hypothetical protein E3Q22_04154 [Wallemia mellicola]TIC00487.1 hypothetical protein E3Q16_03970 [Wallemia mellicola]TIC09426.1 hypothetical protein E3Q14_03395 [Wallemia mellicola]TIC13163.1 hypothetical protein E3Q13_03984 [Wallemia mellicola]
MAGYSKKISPIDLPSSRDDLSISGDSISEDDAPSGSAGISRLSNFINWKRQSPRKETKSTDERVYNDKLEEEARVERDRSKFEARVILNIESAMYDTHQLIHTQNESLESRMKEVEHKNKFLAKHLLETDSRLAEQTEKIRVLEQTNKDLSTRNKQFEDRLTSPDDSQQELQELRTVVGKLQSDLKGLSVLALERIQGLEKAVEKGEVSHHKKNSSSLSSVRDENTPTVKSPTVKSPTKQQAVKRSPGSPVKQSPAIKARAKQFT